MRRLGDADPAHAEHVTKEFVGQVKAVRTHPVAGHQQPARETRFDDMKAIAGRSLRDLGHQGIGVQMAALLQRLGFPQVPAKRPSFHPQGGTGSLNQRTHQPKLMMNKKTLMRQCLQQIPS